eukprot:5201326-Ditylum_brightwellii.AAC.1
MSTQELVHLVTPKRRTAGKCHCVTTEVIIYDGSKGLFQGKVGLRELRKSEDSLKVPLFYHNEVSLNVEPKYLEMAKRILVYNNACHTGQREHK